MKKQTIIEWCGGVLAYTLSPFLGLLMGTLVGNIVRCIRPVSVILIRGMSLMGAELTANDLIVVCGVLGFFTFMASQPLFSAVASLSRDIKDWKLNGRAIGS